MLSSMRYPHYATDIIPEFRNWCNRDYAIYSDIYIFFIFPNKKTHALFVTNSRYEISF